METTKLKEIIAKYKSLLIAKEGDEFIFISNTNKGWVNAFEKECEDAGINLYYTTAWGGKDYKIYKELEKQTKLKETWNTMTVPDLCISCHAEPRYTAAEILAAAEEGEVCMIDAEYIVTVLQRTKTTEK